MTITIRPRCSLGRGKTLVPSPWQTTADLLQQFVLTVMTRNETIR